MAIGRAAGYPDLTYDDVSKLIPILFASTAREKLYDATYLTNITNQNVIGASEIKQMGDRIIINTTPDVPIHTYNKGELLNVDYLESAAVEMTIDFALQFNFAVDEIDLKQVKIKDWINRYAEDANKQMKITIETAVLAGIAGDMASTNQGLTAGANSDIVLGTSGSALTLTKANVLSKIIQCGQVLTESNVPRDENWFMLIPPAMATVLQDSDLKNASMMGDASSVLRNKGLLGEIANFKLYVTNLLPLSSSKYTIYFGHKMALWFVSQYTSVKMYEPERSFAKAMKGLNVYGYGVLQPTALGQMVCTISYS